MNLVIDIGNSRTKYSVYENYTEIYSCSNDSFLNIDIERILKEYHLVNKCILSASGLIPEDALNYLNKNVDYCLLFTQQTELPYKSDYKTINTIGLDRLAGVAGAQFLYPDKNVLIVDMGTAITYDLKNTLGIHLGGNISPGMHMRFKALHEFTENLPLIKPKHDLSALGLSTSEAIENGVLKGIIGEINEFIDEIENNYNNLTIILTGGDAQFFVNKLKKTIFVVQNLVSTGLNSILSHNAKDI